MCNYVIGYCDLGCVLGWIGYLCEKGYFGYIIIYVVYKI